MRLEALLAASLLSQQSVRFVLLGLATGSLFALVSLGIVVVHRASGVLNFSAGAVGAVGAFVTYTLRDDHSIPVPVAVGAGLLTGCALGLLTMLVLIALRRASALVKLIATLGVMVAAQGFIQVVWHGGRGTPDSLLVTDAVALTDELRIGQDRLVLIGLSLVLALILWVVYSRTLFGLATAAVSENPRVAASAGWSTRRIEVANLVLAGGLSALAAIFLAPVVSLDGAVLTLTVIPALAAALVGRFSSFGLAVGAALVIGVLQSLLSLFQADIARAVSIDPLSLTGLPQAVPMAIIVAGTVVAGRSRMTRGESLVRLPIPGAGTVSPARAGAGIVLALLVLFGADGYADALIVTFATAIIVLSLVVVTGYAGQVSLSQLALAGFGAWVAGRLVSSAEVPFALALIVAVLATVPLGLLVALAALRTRGVDLAVATLGLALMVSALLFSNGSLTGGLIGLPVDTPSVLGIGLDPVSTPERYGAFVLVLLVLCTLVVANVRRGRSGRRLLAVRANERVAASLGVSVSGAKLYAFGLSAGLAAVGGVALAFRQTNIRFADFNVLGSIAALQYAVIGGIGWASGAVVGAALASGALVHKVLNELLGSID
ncbi:MAG TPA: ABC transporter permease, partial [Nocardioides sp.]